MGENTPYAEQSKEKERNKDHDTLFEFARYLNDPFLQVVVVTCKRDLQLPFI